jgi:hypothetical protein
MKLIMFALASALLVGNGVQAVGLTADELAEQPDFSAVLAGGWSFLAFGACPGRPTPMGRSFDRDLFLAGDWFEVYRDSEVWF